MTDFVDLTERWVLSPPTVSFWVPGKPRQQGSKRTFAIKKGGQYTGRVGSAEMAKGLADWRHDVKYFAIDVMQNVPMLVDVPVWVKLRFVMPRSTSIPKRLAHTPPSIKKTGDHDKL